MVSVRLKLMTAWVDDLHCKQQRIYQFDGFTLSFNRSLDSLYARPEKTNVPLVRFYDRTYSQP